MRAWIPGDGGYGATLGSAHQNLFMAYVEHMFYTWTLHMSYKYLGILLWDIVKFVAF